MTDPREFQVIMPAAGSSRRLRDLTREAPKALLAVDGRPLVTHSLEVLVSRGVRRVTLVVGYLHQRIHEALGERYGDLALEYVLNEQFATTEHGWSLLLSAQSWARERRPVLLMDADNLYDPAMLDRLLAAPHDDVVLVDERFDNREHAEELVLGRDGRVSGFRRGFAGLERDYAGAFIGINRFSARFMAGLFAFAADLLARRGRCLKYERVLDAFLAAGAPTLRYLPCGAYPWINLNRPEDLERARLLARLMIAGAGRQPVPGPA